MKKHIQIPLQKKISHKLGRTTLSMKSARRTKVAIPQPASPNFEKNFLLRKKAQSSGKSSAKEVQNMRNICKNNRIFLGLRSSPVIVDIKV